jgi:hypothetical protein
VTISGCHSNVVLPGLSLAFSHFLTIWARPSHGFANGSVKYAASSANRPPMSSGSLDSHATR